MPSTVSTHIRVDCGQSIEELLQEIQVHFVADENFANSSKRILSHGSDLHRMHLVMRAPVARPVVLESDSYEEPDAALNRPSLLLGPQRTWANVPQGPR